MPFASTLDLSSLDGSNGFRINGASASDYSGRMVGAAGDVNGDGIADVIVGADNADPNGSNSGAAYVVFGTSAGFGPTLELSALDGLNGFRLDGVTDYDYSGWSVAAAGDVNGDGIDDIIVAAPFADVDVVDDGATYVIFGTSAGFGAVLELSALDGGNGFRIDGESTADRAGMSVSGAGDVNGDGIADIVIGAPLADPNGSSSGTSYVLFGNSAGFPAIFDLSATDGSNGFRINGQSDSDQAGWFVGTAGDVNGDGIDDLIIGARYADPNGASSGATYVVFGNSAGFTGVLELSALDGSNGFKMNGETSNNQSGKSASAAGDVNGDGIDDVIIGAYRSAPNGSASGASYVVFGTSAGFAAEIELSALDGSNGFRVNGAKSDDYSGWSVAAAGDVNGDGIDDVIIGAIGAGSNAPTAGASYVVFGTSSGFAATLELSALDGSNGFKLDGQMPDDFSGFFVSGAGDVNGDDSDDIIISTRLADSSSNNSGASYVVFGIAPPPPPPPPLPTPPPPSSGGNSAPVAGDDAFALPWQTKLTVQGPGLLGNDADADGNPLTVTGILSGPAHGVLAWSADGGFIYQPNAAYVGPDGFIYQVGDGRGGFDTAQVLITVADDEQPDPIWPIDGGFGNERLSGSNQAETIRGNDGDDTIIGDGGRDRLEGNAGNDSVLGQGDEDIAWGGQGNDFLDGGQGNDWVLGERGADTVHGGSGHDFVWGGQGDDRVFGDGGHDMLSGDRGNDTLTGGEGADRFVIKEGGGFDLVADFTSAEGDRIVIDTGGDGILNGLTFSSFADLLARMVDTPDGVFLSLGDPNHGIIIAGIARDQLDAADFLFL